jgi:hypothetical protein
MISKLSDHIDKFTYFFTHVDQKYIDSIPNILEDVASKLNQ